MSVSTEQWIVYVAIALLCDVIGQMLTGRWIVGYVVTAAIGLLGAFAGAYIARSLGAQEPLAVTISGHAIPVLWPIVGATVVAFAVAFFHRRPRRAHAR